MKCYSTSLYVVFIQQPETQHVMVGNNATFSCEVAAVNIEWRAQFPNETIKKFTNEIENVYLCEKRPSDSVVSVKLTIKTSQSWNYTILECVAHHGGGVFRSNATLFLYTSLRKPIWFISKILSCMYRISFL